MNQNKVLFFLLILGVLALFYIQTTRQPATQTNTPAVFDPSNTGYTVDGQTVMLVEGKSETPAAPGSAAKITTTIFGEPVRGDVNGDGVNDTALILVQNSGGSGTFYYAVAAINVNGKAKGTNAVLLGDRVAPQNIEITNGRIIANYADRNPGEPMTTRPSVGISKYIMWTGSALVAAPTVAAGAHCGGNMVNAPICGIGYHCAPEPGSHLPFGDVGGICVKN